MLELLIDCSRTAANQQAVSKQVPCMEMKIGIVVSKVIIPSVQIVVLDSCVAEQQPDVHGNNISLLVSEEPETQVTVMLSPSSA